MWHSKRKWSIHTATSAEELAKSLTDSTWTCCQAFQLGDYLFANDATCADGAQEYGVLKPQSESHWVQIESITFSWCSFESALKLIQQILAGEYDAQNFGLVDRSQFQPEREHGTCGHCA